MPDEVRAIAWIASAGALGAFWLLQWRNEPAYGPSAGGMSNRRILLWSLALSLPAQYCLMLGGLLLEIHKAGFSHFEGVSAFGCPNFHGSGLSPCSFGEMLMTLLAGLLLINLASFGIAFVFMAAIIGAVLLGWRRISRAGA